MKINIDFGDASRYTQGSVRGYVMKYTALFATFLLMVATRTAFAQETDAEQRTLICDDLLQELSQPLPVPEVSEAGTPNFLEPLYTMEKTKLTLIAVFGLTLTLMLRILSQMRLKAREQQLNTHASTLHHHAHKSSAWARKKKRNHVGGEDGPVRQTIRSSMNCARTSLEQFHVCTMNERRPRYTRSYRRFAQSPTY